MQTLGLDDENPIRAKKRFWARQFDAEPTEAQKSFDWAFGVTIPAICFAFDPLIFRGNLWGTALLATYKPFAYLLSFVSIMAIVVQLQYPRYQRDEKIN